MKQGLFCVLIDDDADDSEFFRRSLQRIDPSIVLNCAENGRDGIFRLESYGTNLPDYIFLDLNMHIMNGIECLTAIKKKPGISEIPVIIYSTTLNESIIYETLQLGAFDHIEKPSDPQKLDEYLKRIFQIQRTN